MFYNGLQIRKTTGGKSLPLRQLPSATVGKTRNPTTNQWRSRFQDGCSRGKKLKILIAGLAKSGTTALLFKLKQTLSADALCLFEPKRFDQSTVPEKRDVIAKILVGAPDDFDYPSFRGFDRRILIVRDPRDQLVSRFLYRACSDPEFRNDDSKVSAFVETMRQKEANPKSISLLTLVHRYNELRDKGRSGIRETAGLPRIWGTGSFPMALAFHRQEGEFLVYKYEDFVAEIYAPLENYLGTRLPPGAAVVAEQYEHVGRTRGAGDWAHWFTTSDVELFRPHLLPYMFEYGYEDNWTLAGIPRISPEHASEFVLRSVAWRCKFG
jgi:hypothetical protein